MRHEWADPTYGSPSEAYQAGEQRYCANCGVIQTMTREHAWGRVIRRQWLPLVGKCRGILSMAHTCHWPNCGTVVSPSMWGCREHWFTLPKELRDLIWSTYRKGQEISKTPSPEYIAAAKKVQQWIAKYQRSKKDGE